ncbi:hypothetical protein [Phascolarctobacterium faecium]
MAGDLRNGLVRLRQQRPAIAGGHHKGGVGDLGGEISCQRR